MRASQSSLAATMLALAAGGCALPGSSARFDEPRLASSPVPPGRIEARFMGVTTILLGDGTSQILVDGFFTRPNIGRVKFAKIAPHKPTIRRLMARAGIDRRLRAVLVPHSHYDHVLDAPTIARETGAMLVGSASTAQVGRGIELPRDQLEIVHDGQRLDYAPFYVRVFRSPHSEFFPEGGDIRAPLVPPVPYASYREGGNYTFLIAHRGLSILVHPSASVRECLYRDARADVVFLSIGMLGHRGPRFARFYWDEVVRRTGARLVIPVHWDYLTRSLEEPENGQQERRLRPLIPVPSFVDNVQRAMRRIRLFAQEDGVRLAFMPLFEPIDLEAALPPRPLRPHSPPECREAG